jgi:flagellum-specific ATP synthase
MLPVVQGQRTVLMAGSGVGKSSLLRLLADRWSGRVVVTLVGEREREVMEWERWLTGSEHLAIAEPAGATSGDRLQTLPAALRVAQTAAAEGEHVLLLVDSMTRWTRAAVQLTDPSASPRALPLWVRERLAQFVEGCGAFEGGSITLVMAVLTERDDVHDPLADELRSLTDAHWVLDRGRSESGTWPPFDIGRSVTRLADWQGGSTLQQARESLRQALALVDRSRDAIELGVYRKGESAELDLAIELERQWARLAQRVGMEHGAAERALLRMMQPWLASRARPTTAGDEP